jgi:hypothetical protein
MEVKHSLEPGNVDFHLALRLVPDYVVDLRHWWLVE